MRSPAHCTSCCASVGAGFSCPPSCQPIPGHCRVRQSGHFLETASLLLPPAALRRFPRPREGQSPSPTLFFVTQHRRGGRPCPPARKVLLVTLRRGDPRGRPPAMHHTPWKPCHCEASANTGLAIRTPVPLAPLPKGGWTGYNPKCNTPKTRRQYALESVECSCYQTSTQR